MKAPEQLALLQRHEEERGEQSPPWRLVAVRNPPLRQPGHHKVGFGKLAQVRTLSPQQPDPHVKLIAVDVLDEVRHDPFGAASRERAEHKHHTGATAGVLRSVRDWLG